jgi:hypothetical protein
MLCWALLKISQFIIEQKGRLMLASAKWDTNVCQISDFEIQICVLHYL